MWCAFTCASDFSRRGKVVTDRRYNEATVTDRRYNAADIVARLHNANDNHGFAASGNLWIWQSPICRFARNRYCLILKNFAPLRLCARKLLTGMNELAVRHLLSKVPGSKDCLAQRRKDAKEDGINGEFVDSSSLAWRCPLGFALQHGLHEAKAKTPGHALQRAVDMIFPQVIFSRACPDICESAEYQGTGCPMASMRCVAPPRHHLSPATFTAHLTLCREM